MHKHTRSFFSMVVAISTGIVTNLSAQTSSTSELMSLYGYQFDDRVAPAIGNFEDLLINKVYDAPVDGCYYGVNDPKNTYDPMGINCLECMKSGGKLKKNGSYVWGLTSANNKVYWGTANNLLCNVFGMMGQNEFTAYQTSDWSCDCVEGANGSNLLAPRVYVYDPKNGTVKDLTPDDEAVKGSVCTGLRSAGSLDGIVFLAGPDDKHGLTAYAYAADDDEFLGVSHFENVSNIEGFKITNIRKWLVIDNVLYCGVRYVNGEETGGAILRWKGDREDPFRFEVVGYTDSEAAELAYHDGRIYVGGWPAGGSVASIYRSQVLPEGGLTADHATQWETVWKMSDYETEPFILRLTGIGGFKSYKGRLYWGFLHVTWAYPQMVPAYYGLTEPGEVLPAILGAARASALFSASDFSTPEDVEMLYGEEKLPQYDRSTKKWEIKPNASGYKPKWGRSGLGNLFTNYIWSMEVYNDKLYVGTMDMSNLIEPAMKSSLFTVEGIDPSVVINMLKLNKEEYGYECLVIEDPEKEPTFLTKNGLGNKAAYGIRNMLVHDGQLYVGTANPLDLHENGGWSLFTLSDQSNPSANAKQPEVADLLCRQTDNYVEISSMNGETIESLTLVDMNGRIIRQEKAGSPVAILVTNDLPRGIYAVTVHTNMSMKTIKIKMR